MSKEVKRDQVKFSCKCIIEKSEQRLAENNNMYWVLTSSKKVRFVCFSKEVFDQLGMSLDGEKIHLFGTLTFAVGSTYLNVTRVRNLASITTESDAEFFDYIKHEE